MTATYRIDYTEIKPGGTHVRQSDVVRGGLEDVRNYLDARRVAGLDPIVITEHTKSDGDGRIVPASEWDAADV